MIDEKACEYMARHRITANYNGRLYQIDALETRERESDIVCLRLYDLARPPILLEIPIYGELTSQHVKFPKGMRGIEEVADIYVAEDAVGKVGHSYKIDRTRHKVLETVLSLNEPDGAYVDERGIILVYSYYDKEANIPYYVHIPLTRACAADIAIERSSVTHRLLHLVGPYIENKLKGVKGNAGILRKLRARTRNTYISNAPEDVQRFWAELFCFALKNNIHL